MTDRATRLRQALVEINEALADIRDDDSVFLPRSGTYYHEVALKAVRIAARALADDGQHMEDTDVPAQDHS